MYLESILTTPKKFHKFSEKKCKVKLTESRNPSQEEFKVRIDDEVVRIVVECGWARAVARMVPFFGVMSARLVRYDRWWGWSKRRRARSRCKVVFEPSLGSRYNGGVPIGTSGAENKHEQCHTDSECN